MSGDRAAVSVAPLRFTDDVSGMAKFLEVLGFSPRITRGDGWAEMAGASGLVGVHRAATSQIGAVGGTTELGFDVADLDALAARLTAAGFPEFDIYDEAYGRALEVAGADGIRVGVNERQTDLYGYEGHDTAPEHGIRVMPVLFDPPTGAFGPLFAALGLVREDEGDDEWWRVWTGPGGGQVALHPPTGDTRPRSSRLGFRTAEPLPTLAQRLANAGYPGAAPGDDGGPALTVIDPDGETVLIQAVAGG